MTPEFVISAPEGDLGRYSIWVNGNIIWMLPKEEITPSVKQAIINAYYRGAKDALRTMANVKLDNSESRFVYDKSTFFDEFTDKPEINNQKIKEI